MTQLGISGRANSDKKLTFELLNADARVAASTYVMAGLDAKAETTKSFPINSAGHYVIRLTTEGNETGTYCVLMGGPAMPNGGDAACPTEAAAGSASVPPPPSPPPIVAEVHEAPVAPPAVVAESPKRRRYEVIVGVRGTTAVAPISCSTLIVPRSVPKPVRPSMRSRYASSRKLIRSWSRATPMARAPIGTIKHSVSTVRSQFAPRSRRADCRSQSSTFAATANRALLRPMRRSTDRTIRKVGRRTGASRWWSIPASSDRTKDLSQIDNTGGAQQLRPPRFQP